MAENPKVNLSLVNLGELSKPLNTFIKKISDAIGGLARPSQIVRVAKAEAKATIIRAKTEIEVKNLERRAMLRFAAEEAKKQANIEQIIRDAIPMLDEKPRSEDMANDWIVNFFERCRTISDEDMQRLWSKILAVEANSPGAFAKKTVNILSDLDKADAEFFTRLCGFVWKLNHPDYPTPILIPLIFGFAEIYIRQGITFHSLSHMESLGLIRIEQLTGLSATQLPTQLQLEYFGRTVSLAIPEAPNNQMPVGIVLFTRAGSELARVCGSSPVDGFFEFCCDEFERRAYLANLPKPIPEPLPVTPKP